MEIELERLSERGIGVLTRVDREYPSRLLNSLKHIAPPVLFTAGRRGLLDRGGIAAVGSRNIDESGQTFAKEIGRKCALSLLPLISGGARGTDALAMQSAIEAGGAAVGVLADSLERAVRGADLREALENGNLALITPYSPGASFTVGAAMGRNKLIYALADYAVVVSSEVETGGTWRGATEALKAKWCPVFVRSGDDSPAGNRELLKKGALALPDSELKGIGDVEAWMKERTGAVRDQPDGRKDSKAGEQRSLFD
jgi:predicted Rossmann fold nucleotide-binding protein DprA/Smf involved in DNA uptake